jgi:hypothetical protein
MQSKVVKTLALALLLGTAAVVPGQQPTKQIRVEEDEQAAPRAKQQAQKARVEEEEEAPRAKQKAQPAKSKLEEILAEALKNNPDIRVDAAKLAEAEAKLNRTRVQVTQKVVSLHQAILSQKTVIDVGQKQYDRLKRLNETGTVDVQVVEKASADLTVAKAKLEELEAQMPALLGRVQRRAMAETDGTPSFRNSLEYGVDGRHDNLETPGSNAPQSYRWSRAKTYEFEHAKVTLPQAEKFRKALQTPVKVSFKDVTFDEILKGLSKMVDGLSFRNLFERRGSGHFELPKWSLEFEEAMPLSAILQALEDETGCMFFVREYGIVATTKNGAPLGAMTVEEFLRHKPADESRAKFGALMEGVVNSIDAGGLFTISIGSEVGLAKGQTLELHWKPHKPPIEDARPFGTVRIVEVEAHQAVVQPVGRLSHNPQPGDRIIGSIQKK